MLMTVVLLLPQFRSLPEHVLVGWAPGRLSDANDDDMAVPISGQLVNFSQVSPPATELDGIHRRIQREAALGWH